MEYTFMFACVVCCIACLAGFAVNFFLMLGLFTHVNKVRKDVRAVLASKDAASALVKLHEWLNAN